MTSLLDLNYQKNTPKRKKIKVLLGTPSIDGKIESYYVDSLVNTMRESHQYNIEIFPIFLVGESVLHMARNKIIKLFYESDCDVLLFIDSDQMWDFPTFKKAITSNKSAFAIPVPLKSDELKFNVGFDLKNEQVDEKTQDFTVITIGTGFFKLDRKIINELWNTSEEILFKGEHMKMIFEYSVNQQLHFIGEDYFLCEKIQQLGYHVWTNPNYISQHLGTKIYDKDFKKYKKTFIDKFSKTVL